MRKLIVSLLCLIVLFSIVEIRRNVNAQQLPIEPKGKYGYRGYSLSYIITPIYDEAKPFSENLAPVAIKNADGLMKWGFIDVKGNIVIPLEYDYADRFFDGMAYVEKEGEKGFISKSNSFIKMNLKSGVNSLQFQNGYLQIKGDKNIVFIDKKGNKNTFSVNNKEVLFALSENVFVARDNSKNKIGLINKKGEWLSKRFYDSIRGVPNDGYLALIIDNAKVYIDKNGNEIFKVKNEKTQYGYYDSFDGRSGLLKIVDKGTGLYGYVNKEFKQVIPCNIQKVVHPFVDTSATIFLQNNEEFVVIDTTGKIKSRISKTFFDDKYYKVVPVFINGLWLFREN